MKDIICEEDRDCFLVDLQSQAANPSDLIPVEPEAYPVLPQTPVLPHKPIKTFKKSIKRDIKRVTKVSPKSIKGSKEKKRALSIKKPSVKTTRAKPSSKKTLKKPVKKPIKAKRS